jgi:glycosyltransferase involved in cell wall biosynthesis
VQVTDSRNILMIDRNYMVDRRIVLEAQLLRQMGHQVALVALYSDAGENERLIDGLPIVRFDESDTATFLKEPGFKRFEEITEYAVGPERESNERRARSKERATRERFHRWYSRFFPFMGKAPAKLAAALCAPGFAIQRILLDDKFPVFLKMIVALGTCRFAMMQSVLYSRRRPTVDDGDVMNKLQIPRDSLPVEANEHFAQRPLDVWERKILDFESELQKIDVVHVHDLPALRLGALVSARRGIPLIYDAHELYSYQPGIEGKRKEELLGTEHALIGCCSRVVVINAEQAAIMQRDHGAGPYTALTNATTQPAGFDIRKRYTIVRDRLGLQDGTPTMLFMGSVSRARKIDQLLEGIALSRFPVHAIFLAWGPELEEFEALAFKLGIQTRVHFLAPVPWSEIVYWAASVDVGVMPYQAHDLNTSISSPNKMYEFIAAGTPMIGSTELVNVARVVGDGGFGVLVPFRKAEDYARAIDVMFDPDQGGPDRFRPALIANAEKYLWQSQSREFAEMYRQLFVASSKQAHVT